MLLESRKKKIECSQDVHKFTSDDTMPDPKQQLLLLTAEKLIVLPIKDYTSRFNNNVYIVPLQINQLCTLLIV